MSVNSKRRFYSTSFRRHPSRLYYRAQADEFLAQDWIDDGDGYRRLLDKIAEGKRIESEYR